MNIKILLHFNRDVIDALHKLHYNNPVNERERNQKIATVYFFFIISLIPPIKYIDILIKIFLENVHISISQWILITLIFVLFIYFIVNKDKNKA